MVKHAHSAARVKAAQLWRSLSCTGIAAAAVVACASRAPQWFLAREWSAEPVQVGGYAFVARDSETLTGAGPNRWSSSPDNVRVDEHGVLHLAITEREGRWYSAEVSTPLPDAYCRVRFRMLTEPSAIDLAAIGAVFIYRNDQSELDVELGRWSKPGAQNAQFVVAPPSPARMQRFDLPPGSAPIDFTIDWGPDQVAFFARTRDGKEHRFSYDGDARPEPGGHRLHLSMWLREPSPVSTAGLALALSDVRIEQLPQ
jgi:hypothetical protein